MDWFSSRRNETFTYKKVLFPSMEEVGTYTNITGGSIEYSAFSDLKVSGKLTLDGTEMPDMLNLIRVYYSFTDASGNDSGQIPLATMFMSCSEPEFDGVKFTASIDCYSTLYPLSMKIIGVPRTIAAGTSPLDYAIDLLNEYSLADVDKIKAFDTGLTTTAPYTFDADATYLEIVNWCFDAAGLNSAYPNVMGLIAPIDDTGTTPVIVLEDNENSIIYPAISTNTNLYEVPNVCKLYYNTEDESLWAYAYNDDPTSDVSRVNVKFEKTLYESISENVSGDTTDERVESLKELAATKLNDNSRHVEYLTAQHAWCGLMPCMCVEVDYKGASTDWIGNITNASITLSVSAPTKSKIRKYYPREFEITTKGGWLIKKED